MSGLIDGAVCLVCGGVGGFFVVCQFWDDDGCSSGLVD